MGTEAGLRLPEEGHEEGILKWQEQAFGGDGYVLYFDCDDDSKGLFTCQNLSSHRP